MKSRAICSCPELCASTLSLYEQVNNKVIDVHIGNKTNKHENVSECMQDST